MIDLAALRQSAAKEGAGDAVVTRAWLKQVEQEITKGRVAQAQLHRINTMACFAEAIGRPLERRTAKEGKSDEA